MKTVLKRLFFIFVFGIMLTVFAACGNESDNSEYIYGEEDGLVIHYHRNDDNYAGWNLWLWEDGKDGAAYEFQGQDSFGVWGKYDFGTWSDQTGVNFIVRTNDWAKDPDGDRRINYSQFEYNDEGDLHVYLLTADERIYSDPDDALLPKVTAAKFTAFNQVSIQASMAISDYKIYEDGVEIKSGTASGKEVKVTLPSNMSFAKSYSVSATINGTTATREISVNSLFDTEDFEIEYTYTGNDLGPSYTPESTTFKVWAPTAKNITLRLYEKGTPKSVNATLGDDTYRSYDMTLGAKGVWSVTVDGDLNGKYYTYYVEHSNSSAESTDPYAKSTGINGLRSMILDLDATDPEGWDDVTLPNIEASTDLVIYELHVRDLTSDDTWNGSENNRGKYLGLIETGTTYSAGGVTVTTGFDHIKELGVNAVQLLPIFDYTNEGNEDNAKFNWGYNPLNYNTVEGSYSSNPYDGAVRINELKQVIQAYANEGISIIMDVVYNHVNNVNENCFNKLVPGYYFRYDENGSLSNGSGCGNETASERSMMRKFMVDSTEYWASEFKLGGYRFDLMGLHDKDTMEEIAANLKNVNEDIVVYGEPWTGGTTPLSSSVQCVTNNIANVDGVGAFNDAIRDAIKGSVFDSNVGGWINSSTSVATNGSTIKSNINGNKFYDPSKQINYVSCHDNNTLYDKLVLTGVSDSMITQVDVLAQAIVMTSQGMAFMQAGEEIMRQKINEDGSRNHNSYNSSDEVNSIKWDQKVTYLNEYNQYKELISLRRNTDLFRLSTRAEVSAAYKALTTFGGSKLYSTTIAFELNSDVQKLVVIHNVDSDKTFMIDESYKVLFDLTGEHEPGDIITGQTVISAYSTLILELVTE